MAGNIKGITIELGADTTQLDRALKDVDKSTRNIDKELRQVNNALKFNPTSIELWRQKQDLLKQKIGDTESKLKMLKQQQAAMDAKGVNKNSEEYRKLQREIITTESKLKNFKGQLKSIGNVKLRVMSAQMQEVGSKITAAGQKMRTLSRYAAVATGAIAGLAYTSGKWADDLNTMSKIYHIDTKELQLYSAAAKLVDVDVETIAKTHQKLGRNMANAADGSEKQADAFKKLGIEITNSDGSLRDADSVWQEAIAALGEMDNETERDALAMTLMGKAAGDLNPLIQDGGETYKRVAETMKKYGLDFVDQKTLDDANKFNDQIDTIRAVGALAFQTLGAKLAGVFEPILEKVVEQVGKLANWISGLNPVIIAAGAGISAFVALLAPLIIIIGALISAGGAILGVLAGISAPVIAIGAAIAALIAVLALALAKSEPFRAAMAGLAATIAETLMPVLKQIIAAGKELFAVIAETIATVANDLAPVVTAITPILAKIAKVALTFLFTKLKAVIAVIKVLAVVAKTLSYGIKSAFQAISAKGVELYNKLKSTFSKVKTALTGPFETAKNKIKSIIDAIKGFFNGVSISAPHIPLPHFKITPAGWDVGDLVKGKIPHLSVDWYAKGGIFNSPTIAGIGEAGPEAVLPLDTLWKKLDMIAASSSGNVINVYAGATSDPKLIAREVENVLIQQQKQRMKAWGY